MKSSSVCTTPVSDAEGQTLAIGLTLHHLLIFIAIPFVALTAVACLWLIFKHLHRYTRPAEQRQIIRLVFTPVVFGVIYILSLIFYDTADYITPLPKLYEAFALASLFLLYVHYTSLPTAPSSDDDDDTSLSAAKPGQPTELAIPPRIWILVFQHPPVALILTIAEIASTATGTYCADSRSPKHGHFWITILTNLSLALAFLSILRFYSTHRTHMTPHSPLLKLLSFKLIVGLLFLQNLVFAFIPLPSADPVGVLAPRDLKYGIPATLVCVEMLVFGGFFHLAFRSREYHPAFEGGNVLAERRGVGRAVVDAVNPGDLISGIVKAGRLFVEARREKRAGRVVRRPTGEMHRRLGSGEREGGTTGYGMVERGGYDASPAPPPRYGEMEG